MTKMKIFSVFFIMVVPFLMMPVRPTVGADYVGSQTCSECHDEAFESYLRNSHSIKADPRRPAAKFGCESCHGPGSEHAADEDITKIMSLGPDVPPDQKNAACLTCHQNGQQSLWTGSEHESRGLACTDCHSVHGKTPEALSATGEKQLCLQCHQQIKAHLLRQSRHPLRDGKMTCLDCHNPHGSIADQLIDAQYINLKCFECHAEIRGPYLWEHPPVTEDCLICHTPHGSVRSGLLKGKMPYLCQRCHSDQVHAGNLYARSTGQANQSVYLSLNNRLFYRSCLNCHVKIHGSNHPSGKSLLR